MREIKFRVWDKHTNSYIHKDKETHYLPTVNVDEKTSKLSLIARDELYDIQLFTGLKDKNGKEIYEGDILNSLYKFDGCEGVYEVFFVDGRFRPKRHGEHQQKFVEITNRDLEHCEIIGNIYENPEFLTI